MQRTTNSFTPATSPKLSSEEYTALADLVYDRSRIKLGPNKRELVVARLGKRLRATGIPSFAEYIQFVRSSAGAKEMTFLIDAISTNHTFFMREEAHFQFLTQTAIPQFTKSGGGTFRVWSAASSTGEEAYSTAITLQNALGSHPGWDWRIEGTDISTNVLAKASQGIFAAERFKQVPSEWVARYFQKGTGEFEGYFRARDEIRRRLNFQHCNLLSGTLPHREPFQVIFCRNVMIYFDRETQAELVARLTPLIVPGGYLFIGHAESLTGVPHKLKLIRPAIFQRS